MSKLVERRAVVVLRRLKRSHERHLHAVQGGRVASPIAPMRERRAVEYSDESIDYGLRFGDGVVFGERGKRGRLDAVALLGVEDGVVTQEHVVLALALFALLLDGLP